MDCLTPQSEIMQYADGDLPPQRSAAFESHLASCSQCTTAVAQSLQLRRAVRSAGLRYEPSRELRARVQMKVAPKHRRGTWILEIAFAAIVLIVAAVGVRTGRTALVEETASRQLVADVIDRHVSTLASANPVEVVSSDRHTVKPWFQGKLAFAFNLPELAGTPYVLAGGRLTFLNQSPGAHLIYDLRKHHISVFIFQERDVHLTSWQSPQGSFSFQTWSQSGLRYIVVGDVSDSDLKGLVDLLQKAAAP